MLGDVKNDATPFLASVAAIYAGLSATTDTQRVMWESVIGNLR